MFVTTTSVYGVGPLLRIALMAILTFCLIIRKLKICHSSCHHLIDMLTKFKKNHQLPALLKRPDVRCPYILTKIAMYLYAHVAHSRKIPINPSAC